MCYDINILSLYFDNELDSNLSSFIKNHVESCISCKNKLDLLELTSKTIRNKNYFNFDSNFIDKILENIHPNFEQISSYYDNQISTSAFNSIDKHIKSCQFCKDTFNNIQIISKSLKNKTLECSISVEDILENLDCIPIEDISAYIDNEKTNVRYEKIEKHLKHCEICNNKYNLIRLESETISKLENTVLDIKFADKILEKINENNKIIYIIKHFKSYAHKIAMIFAIVISGVIFTVSNPFHKNNDTKISIVSEDILFSNKVDSIIFLSEKDNKDNIMIQDIGL